MFLDQFTHSHSGKISKCNLGGFYQGYHLVGLHSVSIHFTFKNISSSIGNNLFYYTPTNFIIIPDGAYSLTSFNKYLQSVSGLGLSKVVASYDGTHADAVLYPNSTDKNADTNRIVQNVQNSSLLNKQIYKGTVWCERIKMYSELFNMGTNTEGNKLEIEKFVLIPIQCEPMQSQMYSLNVIQSFEFGDKKGIEIYFTDMDNNILEFSEDSPAMIILDFQEGVHA